MKRVRVVKLPTFCVVRSGRHYSTERKFTVNGSISPDRSDVFYTDVRKDNNQVLLPEMENGKFIMFYGPRASGKSTRVSSAVKQLKEEEKYVVLNTSLEGRVDLRDLDKFWTSFGRNLIAKNLDLNLPRIESASDFGDLLSSSKRVGGHFDKPVVLFVDEFDLLYSDAPPEVQNSLLGLLRDLKQGKHNTHLHSFVGIGPFSVLDLVGQSGSPFNARDAITVPMFTEDQVGDLFQQFSKERDLDLDPRIVENIFDLTDGHPGCVDFCGKEIDEVLLRGLSSVSYEDWMRHATDKLPARMGSTWPTMQKMVNELSIPENRRASPTQKERSEDILEAREMLFSRFLHTSKPVKPDVTRERHARYLASEGALTSPDDGVSFRMRSQMIRNLLINKILPLERRKAPTGPAPLDSNGHLDIKKTVKEILPFFSPEVMTDADTQKDSSAPRADKEKAPQEECYQAEIIHLLQQWLPRNFRVASQAKVVVEGEKKVDRPRHSDIRLRQADRKTVLELVAHTSKAVVEEHINRAGKDAKVLGAKEAAVLHFTTGEFEEWPVGKTVDGVAVSVINIKHDSQWRKASLISDAEEEEVKF